jgi:GT2 family glycosyltransferase
MTTHILDFFGILLVAATLPVVLELALLTPAFFFPSRRSSRSPAGSPGTRLAVVVPAHNEESLISRCVESLRASAGGTGTRIVVIAHNCSDQTARRAVGAGAEVLVYDDPAATGKGFALLRGFERVLAPGSDIDSVLVVDADSIVTENLIEVVRATLAGGAEAVQCRYEMESDPQRPKTRLTALAFRGFNLIRAGGRHRLGLSAGILGNGFALRRAVLDQTPYNALSVVEDLEYHVLLLLSGKRVRFIREAVVSSRAAGSERGEVAQRSRWEGGRAGVARRWLTPLVRRMMSGRIHLLEPILDLSSLPLGYAALALLAAVCLPLGWLRIYSILALGVMMAHVLAAAWTGPSFAGDLRTLLSVPAYIFWKVRILPRLFQGSRSNAAWVRTERAPISPDTVPAKAGRFLAVHADRNPRLLD